MDSLTNPLIWLLGIGMLFAAAGIILTKKPVHAALYFLLTLGILATLYLQLNAPFISVMQIWVYAGAILVIFMFILVLFQDAHAQIEKFHTKTTPALLIGAAILFGLEFVFEGNRLLGLSLSKDPLPGGYGTVQSIGKELYLDFFFPFESVVLLFMVAIIGAVFIGKRED